ncbi:MAG TPA: TIGR00730 family Rossman fold protein [bacterium]|nr:TIGR00730 family Rossman fold protein [bacterium]
MPNKNEKKYYRKEHKLSMNIKKVCIYCASSRQTEPVFRQEALRLGEILATNGITLVYGGSAAGSMGALAQGAMSQNGRVIGVIPKFMVDLEWANQNISELVLVNDLQERKQKMIEGTDAAIALPGGSGTLDELLEAITWKRLGIYLNPIIIVNTNQFYDPLIEQLHKCIDQRFMDQRHSHLWTVVDEATEVLPAIQTAPHWMEEARYFAAI